MPQKAIDDVTEVDVKINDRLGIYINDHSGVVEIAVLSFEKRRLSCGCCYDRHATYTTATVTDDDLGALIDAFGTLKSDYYDDNLEESMAWKIKHDNV